jgi:hypothetical protein
MTTEFTSFSIPLMKDNNVRPLAMLPVISFLSNEIKENANKDVLKRLSEHKIPVLIDTGSVVPVWTADLSVLKGFGATFHKSNVPFSGFGGTTYGDAYNLPDLYIGKLHYKDIKIVASTELGNVPFLMIISATMFRDTAYEIDMIKYDFNVRIPKNDSFERKLRVYSKVKDSYENLSLYLE